MLKNYFTQNVWVIASQGWSEGGKERKVRMRQTERECAQMCSFM